ncbi:mannonate dehydratase [Candidatus Azobacteroides pseudotrichonymphae]|uniref:Mannonate dehydratase n=1 Tax=Azobacteroides pseudotrichonymphae genomovar. CFP2 TaxID=511995 RepID=B6YQG2_AZOPC|nr:mannonate dehydratase [Candidatus Azobacteroides pseudotrichonymphae]BAG83434.1 mannonate dehydratase [Candidatus Azobacteroides pseudotrichonymphae genomovar. CFP2]
MIFEKTWRWFGKNDSITLSDLRQIGVEGIVTALHHIPNGEVWSGKSINDLKCYIENSGLRWSVVESLPVSESIKYAGRNRNQLIENYKVSLANLGKAGVRTVCYNFMPVIDWIRTDLARKQDNGTYSLYFDLVRFAYFDIHILKRVKADRDYSSETLEKVHHLATIISTKEKEELIENIIVKTQGFVNGNIKEGDQNPVAIFNRLLVYYKDIGKNQLRENLKYFLQQVIPVAEEYGVNLCIHPDDPPFPVFGLPRIITNEEDIAWFLNAVDNFHNGLTFCAGSLSAGRHNDVVNLAKKFASRTHFVHLRSTNVLPNGDFVEASPLEGRGNLLRVIEIFKKYQNLPMRVDHGPLMLTDIGKEYNPGYSFLGRMKALGEISGMMEAVLHSIG